MPRVRFEWDPAKNRANQAKHSVPFDLAQYALADPSRVVAEDLSHSTKEKRYFCFGRVGDAILTVWFTYRRGAIRIFGAGYWRKGQRIYGQARQVHRGADRKGPRRS